jgi:hypothetical protein
MNFQLLSKQRKFILIFSVLGFISMFLPWVSLSMFGSTQSINGMHNRGIIIFFCFIIAGIIAIKDQQQKKLEKTMWMLTLFAGALSLVFTFWFYSEATSSILGSSLVGVGTYLSALSALGIILSAYLMKAPEDNISDGFNSLKASFQRKLANPSNATQNSATPPTVINDPINNIGENENITPVL